jgi:hypothetical protein
MRFIKKENFMVFSLDKIRDDSHLNLNLNLSQAIPLALVEENIRMGLGNEFSYEFCDQISKICGTVRIIPDVDTVIFDYDGFCRLVSESDMILDTVSCRLSITKHEAMNQAQLFFQDKNIIVQASGAQGALYKAGSYLQSAGSAGLVANTLALAKLAGVSGLQILKAQPILVVAIPTTGAIFFYACGAIVGNNAFGKSLVTTGDLLSFPMAGVEVMWNSYASPVIQKVFGIPIILNMTQSFKTGPGYTLKEIIKYIPLNSTSVLKTVKKKIIEWLSK